MANEGAVGNEGEEAVNLAKDRTLAGQPLGAPECRDHMNSAQQRTASISEMSRSCRRSRRARMQGNDSDRVSNHWLIFGLAACLPREAGEAAAQGLRTQRFSRGAFGSG